MKPRIVIADDEALIAMDIAEMLDDIGYEVVGVAKDGVEAFELGKKKQPDVFLLDIKMPRMDGIQTARRIAADGLGPVVLLTAYADDGLIDQASESGVYGYILKPVTEGSLRASLKIALGRFSDQQVVVANTKAAELALKERKIIDKAKGIVMKRYGLDEDIAFSKMRSLAMKKGWKLVDLANQIIQSSSK